MFKQIFKNQPRLVCVVLSLVVSHLMLSTQVQASLLNNLLDPILNPILNPVINTINPDVNLNVPQLIQKYGYPVQTHNITTSDGYKLTIFRIPHGRTNGASTKGPVYLQHGFLMSSFAWIMNRVDKALAYRLADAGYDVWLGNCRGTKYSQGHVQYTTDDPAFWDFSVDEISKNDITPAIDYILNVTGYNQTFYIGHSMGTTVFFNAMNIHPEYNAKIRLMVALAPVVYMEYVTGLFVNLLGPLSPTLSAATTILGSYALLPDVLQRRLNILGAVCSTPLVPVCNSALYLLMGYDGPQTNSTWTSVILTNVDAVSTKVYVHYAQEKRSTNWQFYDYGPCVIPGVDCNEEHYGQTEVPLYDPSKVTAPVILIGGANDNLADPQDVGRLAAVLPNLVQYKQVSLPAFNHIDFLFAKDCNPLVYDEVLEQMNSF